MVQTRISFDGSLTIPKSAVSAYKNDVFTKQVSSRRMQVSELLRSKPDSTLITIAGRPYSTPRSDAPLGRLTSVRSIGGKHLVTLWDAGAEIAFAYHGTIDCPAGTQVHAVLKYNQSRNAYQAYKLASTPPPHPHPFAQLPLPA